MEDIWSMTCQHFNVPENVTKAWYTRIKQQLSASSEPTRLYHNWEEMLQRKQEHLQQLKPSLVMAAFFQYYHFETNRNCVKENCLAFDEFCKDALIEEESKCLILKLLGDKTIDSELSTEILEDDANLLQDLDLVILAAPTEDYKRYTQLLRREYLTMNDEHYRLMRLKVLETLLMIPNIFSTPEFQGKYEASARENIASEIKELKA